MISIDNLSVSIGTKEILKGFNASIPEGITCVIGLNGSGKTTLLRTIEGIVKAKEGTIKFNDESVFDLDRIKRAKTMSYLPQSRTTPSIDGGLLIEHARFPYLGFQRKLDDESIKAINKAVDETNTKELLDKKLNTMSGGEKQRIYFASLLAQESSILLLDEPTESLDLPYQIEILNIVKNMKDKTVIMVLHDLLQAFSFGDNILVVNEGKNVLFGKPLDIYNNEIIEEVFGHSLKLEDDLNSIYKFKILK